MNKQNIQHDRENHEHTQTRNWPTNTASIKKNKLHIQIFKNKIKLNGKSRNPPFSLNVDILQNKNHKMALQLSAQQLHIHCPKDKQAPLSRLSQCFHGCWISLFLISSLHSTEHCCHALYSRPRSTLQSAREREIEREGE